jgi:hypothetical protein
MGTRHFDGPDIDGLSILKISLVQLAEGEKDTTLPRMGYSEGIQAKCMSGSWNDASERL